MLNHQPKLSVASLFSGCGGLDLGLEGGFTLPISCGLPQAWFTKATANHITLKQTLFETVFACDIKPSAKRAWEAYFQRSDVFHLESLVELVKQAKQHTFTFPTVDVVTGGFPCQDFSIAGKRGGFASHKTHLNQYQATDSPTEETRGMLYYWMREAIALMKPKLFIAENVKGLTTLGNVKHIITEDFRNIGGGYLVLEPQVLHAAHYGVPQNRERVFFIGIRQDLLTAEQQEALLQGTLPVYPVPTSPQPEHFTTCQAFPQ